MCRVGRFFAWPTGRATRVRRGASVGTGNAIEGRFSDGAAALARRIDQHVCVNKATSPKMQRCAYIFFLDAAMLLRAQRNNTPSMGHCSAQYKVAVSSPPLGTVPLVLHPYSIRTVHSLFNVLLIECYLRERPAFVLQLHSTVGTVLVPCVPLYCTCRSFVSRTVSELEME